MVKREAGNVMLESFARCPTCNRNDRVEKVSGIYKQETGDLRSKIGPPQQPNLSLISEYTGCIIFPISLITFFLIMGYLFDALRHTVNWPDYSGIFCGIAGFFLSFLIAILVSRRAKSKNKKRQEVFQAEGHIDRWQKSMAKWEALYYCRRDDCVFDPTTKAVVPVDKIGELIKPEL